MQHQTAGDTTGRADAFGSETRGVGRRTKRTAFAAAGLTALIAAATAGCTTTALGAPTQAASLGANGASATATPSSAGSAAASAGSGSGQGASSGGGSGSSGSGGSGGSSSGTPECTASALTIDAVTGPSGSTHVSELLHFSNNGSHTCFLRGYPGVAQVNGSHTLQNAARTQSGYLGGLSAGQSIPTVVLAPGHSASALVEAESAASNGSNACAGAGATGLLVTAPDQYSSVQVPSLLQACADFQVHPITGGSDGSGGSGGAQNSGGVTFDIQPEGGITVTPGGSTVDFKILLHDETTTDWAQVGLVVSFSHCSCTANSLFPAGTLTVDDPRSSGTQSAPYNVEGFGTDFLNQTAVPAIAIMAETTQIYTFHLHVNSSSSVHSGTANVDVTLTDAANNQPVGASPAASLPISVN